MTGIPDAGSPIQRNEPPILVMELRPVDFTVSGVLSADARELVKLIGESNQYRELVLVGPAATDVALMRETIETVCPQQREKHPGQVICLRVTLGSDLSNQPSLIWSLPLAVLTGLTVFWIPMYIRDPRKYHLEVFTENTDFKDPPRKSYAISKHILGGWLLLPFLWVSLMTPDEENLWEGFLSEAAELESSSSR
tara:strand:+ start:251584 stop:252168 length:585 start_codon:yes stop_codon:yes gene_type:complete